MSEATEPKNNNRFRKDKRTLNNMLVLKSFRLTFVILFTAWDTDDIDHWKIEEFKPEHLEKPFTEESSFATLFPKYREAYLKETWPVVTQALDKYVNMIFFSKFYFLYKANLDLTFIGYCLCFGSSRR